MKTTTKLIIALLAFSAILSSCAKSANKSPKYEIEPVVVEEEVLPPTEYYVLSDNNQLYQSPNGEPVVYNGNKLKIDRDFVVYILQEDGEWVKIAPTSSRLDKYKGWVKKDILTDTDYINSDVDLVEGSDYEVFYKESLDATSWRSAMDNYHIYLKKKNPKESELIDIANTLKKRFKNDNTDAQIWLYDVKVDKSIITSFDLSRKDELYLADHEIYYLTPSSRIGEYYPLQSDYKEYKALGGKNWKKSRK